MIRTVVWGLLLGALLSACGSASTDGGSGAVPPPVQQASLDDDEIRFGNVAGDASFVGDAACFDCHEDLWRSYQSHGMAQSYYPLTGETRIETPMADTLYHAATDLSYRVVERDGRLFQEEVRRAADGTVTHRLAREMEFVVGSGTAARTYLTEEQGRLYELPITWYTQAQRWDFSPGYRAFNARFDRLIPDRCMACHNSYPTSVPFAQGKYTEVPQGIGCERCHGPGSLHVEARLETPEPAADIDTTIVNPKHLSLDLRLDVCQQCHLHGSVSLLREGRTPFDFRPSQRLDDFIALFSTKAEAEDQIDVISHADRMKRSACFIETQGRPAAMDCVTCHNPHEGFREAGPSYFNETCIECHATDALQASFAEAEVREQHTATANCIDCHMPKVEAEDAPHASFTDHWIRVVREEASAPTPAPAHAPVTLTPYFARDEGGGEGRVYEGMAYIVYGQQQRNDEALRKGVDVLTEALDGQAGFGEAHFLHGLALMRLGETAAAIPALEEAVRQGSDIPERLNALAQAYEADGRDPTRIERLYRRALDLQPALADVRVNYGRFLETQERTAEAMTQYEAAIAERPWLEIGHFNQGTALLRQGQFEEAEAALRQAIALDPNYVQAYGNLGMLYATEDDPQQARQQFEAAVAAAPEDPVALGNLGSFYLNHGDLRAAIDLLTRAVEADPTYVDGLANLALAHFRNGDMAQAQRYAEAALDQQPNHPLARQILGAL
ncbi:MAG: tetratricopeptide repeat protein [Bacteroidetes bacterium]|jgi:Tfp pilus assembly protein PilF|nr:tetratricopeptide repeat protein [Bacteroidota bacterium]